LPFDTTTQRVSVGAAGGGVTTSSGTSGPAGGGNGFAGPAHAMIQTLRARALRMPGSLPEDRAAALILHG